jgi:hypothetical protein
MSDKKSPDELMNRFFTSVKSLLEFTDAEVHVIVQSVGKLSPTDRENCFLAIYFRAYADLKTLMRLSGVPDFQTVSRIARAMLEYAVDLRLIDVVPDSINKMATFVEVERLRSARRAMEFLEAHPEAHIADVSIFQDFVINNEKEITAKKDSLWPKTKKSGRLDHWSEMSMEVRCKKLGLPFEQWYAIDFRRLSWHTHTGLAGVVDLPAVAFKNMLTAALIIIMEAYCEVLVCVIKELKIDRATQKIHKLMEYAKKVPFTNTAEDASALFNEMMR